MATLITIAVIALLIALGTRLIHRLNAQHDARIAAHHFGDAFPPIRRPPGPGHRTPTEQAAHRRRTGTWP
ncbi:hypothetical protein R6L23_16805 [Streptomyces sp. SR27]|uniref:hypothetical protein n=1 Tax=unclassified Streptomyces TaxID=2593676 RepID=UPI00295BE53F|nr:hypothetical protein [Streptomyces sp. SR27]MDV9189856.1 hypothetical protein [Streptomyces sp. SR27]